MDTSKMTTPNMKKKLYFVIIPAFMLAFSIILYNLVDITVIKHDDYLTRATSQQLKPKNIPAKRGTIYDRNMAVLAQSATVWDLVISPSDMEETQKEFIANTLSKIIAKTPEEQELYRQKIIDRSKRNSRYEIIAKKLEKPIADEIRKAIIEGKPNEDASKKNDYLVGIDLVESAKRYYPNSTFASSVIGFTGADSQGLYGIEYYYDKQLSGTPGYIVSAQNALGENMPVSYENKFDPIDGNNLVLTLDESAQFFLEKALNKLMVSHKPDEGCAGIIMDVNTGEILAMATMPNFDLNAPFEIGKDVSDKIKELPQEEQKDAYTLAQQKQWKNKNINFTYEPGSTFKPLVAAAALEEKTSSLESRFYCTGSIEVDGVKMRCHKDGGHGQENFTDALVNSCNPAYVKIGADLGANLYFKYFKAFGLTQKTGIDLPGEEMGFYYTADKLTPVSLASCSFGQSLTLTPIQLCTSISAVVNGGNLVTPHTVKTILDQNGNVVENISTDPKRQVISEETSATIREMMERVVDVKGGTNASVKGYRIGGKSGTAQKLGPGFTEDDRIASYVAVAPADKPEVLVYIMVDEATSGDVYGSVIAAPGVASVMYDLLPYLGYAQQFTSEEEATKEIAIPYLLNLGVLDAESKLISVGLTPPIIIGEGNKVIRQLPDVGQKMSKDGKVYVYTQNDVDELVEVPDVVGMSPKEAKVKLEKKGLNVIINGLALEFKESKITNQSIEVGKEVSKGTVIEIVCLKSDTD